MTILMKFDTWESYKLFIFTIHMLMCLAVSQNHTVNPELNSGQQPHNMDI